MSTGAAQGSLPDISGATLLDFGRDATPPKNDVVDFRVASMAIQITCNGNKQAVLPTVLEALSDLQMHKPGGAKMWLSGFGLKELHSWEMEIYAGIQPEQSNGIIKAIQHASRLDIYLPPTELWTAHGLDWLLYFQRCCERNRLNKTPWLGRCCECPPYP